MTPTTNVHQESASNNQSQDIEAATPTDASNSIAVEGHDVSNSSPQYPAAVMELANGGDERKPPGGHCSSCINCSAISYAILLVVFFTWPFLHVKTQDDEPDEYSGLETLMEVLLIVVFIGGIAAIVSIVSLIVTVSNWQFNTTRTRIVGCLPFALTVLILIVLFILGKVNQDDESTSSECIGDDCPEPKDLTRHLFG